MAASEAPCTPPSVSLAAMLSNAGAQVQCMLFPSSPSARVTTTSDSSAVDDSSSSDKENSPSRALQKSNRTRGTGPAMQTLLQVSPSKQYVSFTPQRTRPLPRAWERRPATPFVPRNEGQKIWKRMPLQEINIDINQQLSRKEKEEKESYIRITKRMRLDAEDNVATKKDVYATVSAVGTKWEEENIENGGSPKKKKLLARLEELNTLAKKPNVKDDQCVDKQNISADHQTSLQVSEAVIATQRHLDDDSSAQSNEAQIEDILQVDAEPEHEDEKSSGASTVEDSVTDQHVALIARKTVVEKAETATQQITHTESDEEISGKAVEPPEQTPSMTVTGVITDTFKSDASLEEITDRAEDDATHGPDVADVESRFYASLGDAHDTDCPTSDVVNVAPIHQTVGFPGTDHDETAFLREFLERAQASKAAKIILSPQKKPATLPPIPETELEDTTYPQPGDFEATEAMEDYDDLSPPIETDQIQQMYDSADLRASSPMRRSARTATRASSSRLPRFYIPSASQFAPSLPLQAGTILLPSTIQLKRATGNEFVFNAKSQQTLTMTTRSNTKRNRGDAVYVTQRLAQLRKEFEVRQQEELVSQMRHGQGDSLATEVVCDMAEDATSMSKKRKREKQDAGKASKARRNVKWAKDDELVRFREPSPSDDPSDMADCIEEGTSLSLPTSEDVQPGLVTDTNTTIESVSTSVKAESGSSKAEPSEDPSKHKVRRIRKIKLDSVNGTPAPKTRSRTMADSESSSTTNMSQDSAAASASNTNPRKSSRMPVPISTSIPMPSFTAAKPNAKSTDSAKDKVKVRTSALPTMRNAKGKEANDASTVVADKKTVKSTTDTPDSDRKLDGRRRLRGRS